MNQLSQLSWQHPWALALLLLPIIIYVISVLLHYRSLQSYADSQLLPWVIPKSSAWSPQRLKNIGYFCAWICLSVALAGPKIPVVNDNESNIDIVFLVDTSRSMSATDVFPSRLQKVKLEILELLQRIKQARFSIIVFAARPHVFVPLTSDRKLLGYYISQLDSLVLPTRGSDINSAIELANDNFKQSSRPLFYILLSDGEYGKPAAIKNDTPPVYALGIGSVSGAGIPIEEGNWLEFDSKQVVSRLNESELRAIAEQTQGAYRRASDDNSDGTYLIDQLKQSLSKMPLKQQKHEEWEHLYHTPLILAIVLLFVGVMPGRQGSVKLAVLLAMTGCGAFSPDTYAGSTWENSAYLSLQAKDYQQAINAYQQIGGFKGHLGSGVAYYLSNKMYDAAREFQKAVLIAGDEDQRANAIFNLANTQFRLGDYEMAIQLYQNTLLYNPDFAPAQNNLKLAQTIWDLILKNLEQIELNAQATPGSGPRERLSTMENIQDFNNSLTIANEDKAKFNLPSLPSVKKLLQQGMENFHIAGKGLGKNEEAFNRHKVEDTQLAIKKITNNNPLLWKSLFEIEEGFPAPQSKPMEIPGESPW